MFSGVAHNLFLFFPFFNGEEGEIGGRVENASGRINDTGWMKAKVDRTYFGRGHAKFLSPALSPESMRR